MIAVINNSAYNIVSENELTQVLSHFNTEFILSIVYATINDRFNPLAYMNNPNVVDSWETNFKNIIQYYNDDIMTSRVTAVRITTYEEIIKAICRHHKLNFDIFDDNLYSAAHYLYDVFVSSYLYHLNTFFANYIITNKEELFNLLELSEVKPIKVNNDSKLYSNKYALDPILNAISNNISKVVTYVCGIDIPFDYILMHMGLSEQESNYMLNIVSDQENFFKNFYVPSVMNSAVNPIRLNDIKLFIRLLTNTIPNDIAATVITSTENIVDVPVVM